MSLPPDLRVLCRRLASAPPTDLLSLCPVLVGHVLRCGGPLSAPPEAGKKENSSEASLLVHKLKTHINTLLNGQSSQGRFAATVLIKAVVDVGGWECLRGSEPWVRGLISALNKPDPAASKELVIVTVTRIYSSLHPYQTLTREITTPTLPSFVTACLQLIKAPAPGRLVKVPMSLIESVIDALSTLIPLYPTTLRPFIAQIRAIVKSYVAPTLSDPTVIPSSLRASARRLLILFHYTTPKNGNAEEWATAIDGFIRDCHITLDQVFRAVQESWESSSGYIRQHVASDDESAGGGRSAEDLPPWFGLRSGSERVVGLLALTAECFWCPSKTPMTIPLGSLLDLVSRIASVVPPSPSSGDHDGSVQTNPSIGREEKEELWSVLPEIHMALMQLLTALVRRLGRSARSLALGILDQTARVFGPSQHLAIFRETTYRLVRDILDLIGPNLARINVDSLDHVLQACCQDLMAASGFLQADKSPEAPPTKNGSKIKSVNTNADLFLKDEKDSSFEKGVLLSEAHQAAAEDLLVCLLESLPQQHVKKTNRATIDRAAILSRNKVAMLASVLHPYMDKSGRLFANTLPFLTRQYPQDAGIEVLRSNLRLKPCYFGDVDMSRDGAEEAGQEDAAETQTAAELNFQPSWANNLASNKESEGAGPDTERSGGGFSLHGTDAMAIDKPAPASTGETETAVTVSLKRKNEEVVVAASKRVDTGNPAAISLEEQEVADEIVARASEDDSDSDESVHLDMTLDDDDEEEEDE